MNFSLFSIEEKLKITEVSFTEKQIQEISDSFKKDLSREVQQAKRYGIKLVTQHSPDYPSRLMHHEGMPYALFYKGELPAEDRPTAAIVGARRCTQYGEQMAIQFSEALAREGVQIISGMAYGVDGAAQRGALNCKQKTFAILGCGVDICYPKEHYGLYSDIVNCGGVISEQPMGEPPKRQHFPARNRIISGLSDMILIMEAKESSGSLITIDQALEQGKAIYALPGNITSPLSIGCNNLISQGAEMLISTEDFIKTLRDNKILTKAEAENKQKKEEKVLEMSEKLVYTSFGLYPKSLNQLLEETKLEFSCLISILMDLELKGYVKEISKNYYVRT